LTGKEFDMRASLLTLLIAGFVIPASAQENTLETLLKEVRALRIAMERSNQIAPRIQIALARIQLQEERVRNAARQLEAAREALAHAEIRRTELVDRVKTGEKIAAQTTDPKERQAFTQEMEMMTAEIERMKTLDQQLRAKEAEASALLLNEQARWNEASDLLTSIERALTPPPQ
jgi:hypothetical protein